MIKIEKVTNNKFLKFIFVIRNLKYIRKESINKKKISFYNHKIWYENYIKKNKLLLIKVDKNYAGYIRIDNNKNRKVSWAIKKSYWGKINFQKILKNVTKKKDYKAIINKNNIRSQIVALKAGFKYLKIQKNFLILKK